MDFSHNPQHNAGRNLTGITVVVILHVLVGYLVVSGMGKQMIEKIKNPIETKIVEEVKPPPKEEPPPPPPPDIKTPPPPFIPPPEVVVAQQTPPQNVITQTTNVAPPTNQIIKAPPAPPQEVKAPPAPPAATPAVLNVNDCPKLEYPRTSQRNEEEGTVRIEFLVGVDGKVKEAKILKSSGFRDLDRAAVSGLSTCNKFKPGTRDGKPVEAKSIVDYVWVLN